MPFKCKNMCLLKHGARHKAGKIRLGETRTFKICRVCVVKGPWDNKYCPCCGTTLSDRSRARYARTRRQEADQNDKMP